ncbi:heparinase II/III family protein [Paeniglutamicibacter sp. NPDC012692]|uniref:heparinase II/III domain-containing protein n=1 Tax=Paeniglutamicibacter sp. NPDC012692 TaxID=3364388 RepID=UPI003680DAE3
MLDNLVSRIDRELLGRNAVVSGYIVADGIGDASVGIHSFGAHNLSGNGKLICDPSAAYMNFSGPTGIYELRVSFDDFEELANGLTCTYRLDGWDSISYLAIGYSAADGKFRHIKITHVLQGTWQDCSYSVNELAYLIQNHYEVLLPEDIPNLRLYVKGKPSIDGATISIKTACKWFAADRFLRDESVNAAFVPSDELWRCLLIFLRNTNSELESQVETFLKSGGFPIHGSIVLEWDLANSMPTGIEENPTFRYIWNSLYPAAYMAVFAESSGSDAALCSARDLVTSWLRDNYYERSSDLRYAWYDHGTAERLITLLLIRGSFDRKGGDARFLAQLDEAIRSHAQLLESDSFYAANQNSRFHNHAWFQDIALLAAGLADTDRAEGLRWIQKAEDRIQLQFSNLIVRDAGYAIFVENSIGYHQVVQRLVALAGEMIQLAGGANSTSQLAVELNLWSQYFRYPDRRQPSQGDTFHVANPPVVALHGRTPYSDPHATILPIAGYGVAKGNHMGKPFMLSFLATSLSSTHKHADNLSITLFFDGLEWLVDPSFYSHEYEDNIPAYLRGPWAHNSIVLRGLQPSINPGLVSMDGCHNGSRFIFTGESIAYQDYLVRREVLGSVDELSLTITDSVSLVESMRDALEGRTVFHLAEGVSPRACIEGTILTHEESQYGLLISSSVEPLIVFGLGDVDEDTSVIGTSYGTCVESYSLVFVHNFNHALTLTLSAFEVI